MDGEYFSEMEGDLPARTAEEFSRDAWRGIVGEVRKRFDDGSLAEAFPKRDCPDLDKRHFITGCDAARFYDRLKGDHPFIDTPFSAEPVPKTNAILDLIRWIFKHVSKPIDPSLHDFSGDMHYRTFSMSHGQTEFSNEINTIFRRHGLAFELTTNGEIRRLLPPVLRESLQSAEFRTGDKDLDRLLHTARDKFSKPDFRVRYDALKDLWDAFERLKTLEPPYKKPDSARALIERASPEAKVQEMLDTEMRKEQEAFGNGFFIRHAHAEQVSLQTTEEIDYLFHRLFSLIWFLLRRTERAA
jgi:hypothetical protein